MWSPPALTESKPMHVGILLPNWIGDAVMATPALRAIWKHYRGTARLTAIMKPPISRVLDGLDWFDETVYYHRRSKDRRQGLGAVAHQLRQQRLDTMIVLPNSFSSGLLARLSGARERVGYARGFRSPLLTQLVYPPQGLERNVPVAAVDNYLKIAYTVGCATESKQMELRTLPTDEQAAERIWDRLGLTGAGQVVLMNTGSANSAARDWPLEYFARLACELVAQGDTSVLVICGPAEMEAAQQITRLANHPRVVNMADQDLSLGVSKACIRRASLLVSTDSGPRHIGAALGVPVLSLCGPIDPRWSHNYHPGDTILQHHLPCSPCDKNICPLKHNRCMHDLSVDRVLAAALDKLGPGRRSQAA